jgi:hypothetical protein
MWEKKVQRRDTYFDFQMKMLQKKWIDKMFGRHALVVDDFELSKLICDETVKFYEEYPEQFEQIKKAGDFKWATMTMLSNRIRTKIKKEMDK